MVRPGRSVRRLLHPGPDAGHTWAYLPDLAETIARLLDPGVRLRPFKHVPFPGRFDPDGRAMVEAVRRAIGRSVTARRLLLHTGAGALAALVLPGASSATAASPEARPAPPPEARDRGAAFWNAWLGLWNGDLDAASGIVSPTIRVHTTPMDGHPDTSVSGIDAFVDWIGRLRSAFDGLVFDTTAGPLVDRAEISRAAPAAVTDASDASVGLLVAGHWTAGTRVRICRGARTLRTRPLARYVARPSDRLNTALS